MSKAQTYEIRTVDDFLQVPQDRRAICLCEFAEWLRLGSEVGDQIKPWGRFNTDVFRWIDDGKGEMRIRIIAPPSSEAHG